MKYWLRKIEFVVDNAMGMKTSSKTAEWLAKGIGMVKSENYDNKGNLESYSELVSLSE